MCVQGHGAVFVQDADVIGLVGIFVVVFPAAVEVFFDVHHRSTSHCMHRGANRHDNVDGEFAVG